MATTSVWLTAVSILAAFNIGKYVDDKGKTVEQNVKFLSGLER